MGLCKCPKRRVTNQFCFEHRVNVCEHCMVTNHPKCIVQSYLQWLQDSDYNPICELCTKELNTEDCIRLTCYHIYHWWCLDSWARNLPNDTAPAGFTCPSCSTPLFPASNLVSPVADVLREKLAGVNWARVGLGLPMLSEEVNVQVPQQSSVNEIKQQHSIVHVPSDSNLTNSTLSNTNLISQSSSRRSHNVLNTGSHTSSLVNNDNYVFFDNDDDKYKRRSPADWFVRKWKYLFSPVRRQSRLCRPTTLIVLAVILIVAFIGFMGRWSVPDDLPNPNFDLYHQQKEN